MHKRFIGLMLGVSAVLATSPAMLAQNPSPATPAGRKPAATKNYNHET